MAIKTDLNIAPYFDDYDITKKYYRVLFKPGFAVQARELTQLQTTLQNQIEQFGENIYKEGSIIKGCTFTELRNLKYIKVVDGIRPESFVERTERRDNISDEYYYEIEDESGLKAIVVQGTSGFLSRAPNLNTFFVFYLNTSNVGGSEKKEYLPNDTLTIKEYILRTERDESGNVTEGLVVEEGTFVASATVAPSEFDPIGDSFGLNASEGVVFQLGHFLFVDDQTIVVKKYMDDTEDDFDQPNRISIGYVVDESIVSSQQDLSLLDNSNGSPNENAPGADRLLLVPRLVARDTDEAEEDSEFFILRRYENGVAVETRDVSQFNSIATEMARRTYETNGDFTKKAFQFEIVERSGDTFVEMSEGVAYTKGYRISNDGKRFFRIPPVETTQLVESQPININYGGFLQIVNSGGRFTIGNFQKISLLDDQSDEIGTAVVKNFTPNRIYLFAIRMNAGQAPGSRRSFSEVRFVREGSNLGLVEVTPSVINSADSRLVFSTYRPFMHDINGVSLSFRRQISTNVGSGNNIIIAPPPGTTFDSSVLKDLLVISNNTNLVGTISPNGANIRPSDGNLVINMATLGPGTGVTVYHNIRFSSLQSRQKIVNRVFVKVTALSDANKYSVGLPDAIELISVKSTDGTKDYTNSFILRPNQKDDFYDHSYIERVPGSEAPSNNEQLIVQFDVFRPDTVADFNMFDVRSYSSVPTEKIPFHTTSSGEVLDLKACLDFRPYRIPAAAYSTNEAGATVLSNAAVELPPPSVELFESGINYGIPAVDTSGSADIEYFVNRTDFIVGSSYGRFKYIVGDEGPGGSSINTDENTIIAEVRVPGFPLLTAEDAFRLNRRNETPNIVTRTVNRYTMKDIDGIAKKIERLTYYVTLSQLEASTRNLSIQDENGLNRFKNGIIVDPFNDLSIADVSDPSFNASIDTSENSLKPSQTIIPLNLRVYDTQNTQRFANDKVATITPDSEVELISQRYATNFRSCTSNFWRYKGVGAITPDYDTAYDTVNTPAQINIDLERPFSDFAAALAQFIPLTTQANTVISTSNTQITNTTTDITQIIQTLTQTLQVSGQTQTQFVGDFVRNFQFEPYMRSREVAITLFGLRPNTKHFFFFDEQDVNEHVAPGSEVAVLTAGGLTVAADAPLLPVIRNGEFGDDVTTNDRGELYAIFRIPAQRFFVGERKLTVVDVPSFDDIASASSSKASLAYNAYNFSVQKSGLTVSTRQPVITIDQTTTTRTVTNRVTILPPERIIGGGGDERGGEDLDPLAQTFFVKSAMAQGAEAVYLSRVDLFFKRKSPTNGVTVMIREVENGYPSIEMLPFASKHLKTTEVNTSADGTAATPVYFDAPIRLETEKEYALVILPDQNDPDYLHFTVKVGGTDLSTNEVVNMDWGDGVLFTSTNNRAWTAYQDEDLKFTVYRYNFNTDAGSLTLETDDLEFFETRNTLGQFVPGELVYSFVPNLSPVQIAATTNSVTATGSGSSTFNVGDYVYLQSGTDKDILRIVSTAQNQIKFDRFPTINASQARRVVAGTLSYFNPLKPFFMVLERSSARGGRTFNEAQNSRINGFVSGAISEIENIQDIELSYVQSMINRIADSDHRVFPSLIAIDPKAPNDTPYEVPFSFASNKAFNEKGCMIFSKSNSESKNLKIRVNMSKEGRTTTPLIDVETASLSAYIYNITDDEETTSRYIAKRVELREGFDSEDFRLYITGYRPIGTDIIAYIKIRNEADPVSLADNRWIRMQRIEGENLFSSASNTDDFKEFVWEIPAESKDNDGIATYTNETGTYSTFRSFAIRIDMLSDSVSRVPRMLDYRGVAFE
jgi:hypothetical protein